MPEISVLVRPRQEDYHKLEVALSYTMRPCLRNKTKLSNLSVYGLGVWASEVKTYEHRIFFSCQGYCCCFVIHFKRYFGIFLWPMFLNLVYAMVELFTCQRSLLAIPLWRHHSLLILGKSGVQVTWLVLCLFRRPFLKDVSWFF